MFMFRSRRRNLTDRLLGRSERLRRCQRVGANGGAKTTGNGGGQEDVLALLEKLQKNQLEMLLAAVDSRGTAAAGCVLVPRGEGVEGGGASSSSSPHVLCCRAWRWPEVRRASELRRLPACPSAADPVYVCCNPYHWSRLWEPDTPPPPYSRSNNDRIKPEDRAPSEVPLLTRDSFGSLTTNGGESYGGGVGGSAPAEWCRLAYWERDRRVGPLFPVEPTAVNVFGGGSREVSAPMPGLHAGLCLDTLADTYNAGGDGHQRVGADGATPVDADGMNAAAVKKTRAKIGLGVTVSLEGGRVWVYNRGEHPVFLNSPSLDTYGLDCPAAPLRLPPDHCACAFDPERAAAGVMDGRWAAAARRCGPVDPNSVRISFVKGWGQNYSRQEITSCPCWIEVLLAPCR